MGYQCSKRRSPFAYFARDPLVRRSNAHGNCPWAFFCFGCNWRRPPRLLRWTPDIDPEAAYREDFLRLLARLELEPALAIALAETVTGRPFETCTPMQLVPLLKELWSGGCAHEAPPWVFPETVATPPPVQRPHPPLWIAARHPAVFDFAVREDCDIMANPRVGEALFTVLETQLLVNSKAEIALLPRTESLLSALVASRE